MEVNGAAFLSINRFLERNIGSGAKAKRVGNSRSWGFPIKAQHNKKNKNANTLSVILRRNIGSGAHTCFAGKPFVALLSPLVSFRNFENFVGLRTRIRCLRFPPGLCSTVLFGRAFFVDWPGPTDS